MKSLYFSGFCLQNDKELFKEYLENSDFNISGFSYGSIKAMKYTLLQIKNNKRVQKLQLFSPAFFQDKDKKYKRLQLMFFKKNEDIYKNNFIKNISIPNNIELDKYLTNGKYEELDILLNYEWNKDDFNFILEAGVKIEVFLGSDDQIINSQKALEFFRQFAEVYYIKNVGHILK